MTAKADSFPADGRGHTPVTGCRIPQAGNGRPVLLFHLPAQKPGRRLDEFLFHIPHSGSGIAV